MDLVLDKEAIHPVGKVVKVKVVKVMVMVAIQIHLVMVATQTQETTSQKLLTHLL